MHVFVAQKGAGDCGDTTYTSPQNMDIHVQSHSASLLHYMVTTEICEYTV